MKKVLLLMVASLSLITLLLIGLPISAADSTNAANGDGFVKGDVNGDGVVDMGDVTKVERMILGQDSATPAADVNQDGVVNMADVVAIEKIILGRP